MRLIDRDMAATLADHKRQLAFIIQFVGHLGPVYGVAAADYTSALLGKKTGVFGLLPARFGNMIGIVQGNSQIFPRDKPSIANPSPI